MYLSLLFVIYLPLSATSLNISDNVTENATETELTSISLTTLISEDDCFPNPCKHGICWTPTTGQIECSCYEGYWGSRCQYKKNTESESLEFPERERAASLNTHMTFLASLNDKHYLRINCDWDGLDHQYISR
ncbi:uncharacterized protein [Parasteatoda tepidariorum]|uniref:uncharacterized protein isoform X1 n=1 Tax=Parasteatoda tepidariorum TaxID=114398 RepID=UPI0039BCD1CE